MKKYELKIQNQAIFLSSASLYKNGKLIFRTQNKHVLRGYFMRHIEVYLYIIVHQGIIKYHGQVI